MKSLATLAPRKDPILNQDINTLGIEKYQSLPPHLPKFFPGCKSLRNEAGDDSHEYTDRSHNNKYGSIDNLKAMNKKNSYYKYKEVNLQHQYDNVIVVKKTKEEGEGLWQLISNKKSYIM